MLRLTLLFQLTLLVARIACLMVTMLSVLQLVLNVGLAMPDRMSPLQSPYVRLYNHLFTDYQKAVRPIMNPDKSTNVIVSPNLYSIINVEEGDETLIFSRWFQMFWTDPFLVWNPADFNGTEELLVDVHNIWVPDITIIEMLSGQNAGTVVDFASIMSDGTVRYSLNDIIHVYCSFDVQKFPYDKQNCSVSYVSWEYPADQITVNALDSAHNNLMFYGKSAEWSLVSYSWTNLSISDNSSISFDGVTYFIAIQRKPMFYVVSLVLPSFLITTLSIVGIFSPSEACNERKERITIGLTASLAMSVVLMMVSNLMPKSDKEFPLLGKYMLWQMVITGAATVVAVVVMYIQAAAVSLDVDLPEWLLRTMLLSHSDIDVKPIHHHRVHQHQHNGAHPTVTHLGSNGIAVIGDNEQSSDQAADQADGANGHNKTAANQEQVILNAFTHNNWSLRSPRDPAANAEMQGDFGDVLRRIDRILHSIGGELEQRQLADKRSMLAIRFCYRLDILLNVVFNLINVVLAFDSFDFLDD